MTRNATSPADTIRSAGNSLRAEAELGPVTLNPPVALAVADWLEASAKAHEGTSANTASYSLKIARAYLGEPMP